jgi:hypothetical protein
MGKGIQGIVTRLSHLRARVRSLGTLAFFDFLGNPVGGHE